MPDQLYVQPRREGFDRRVLGLSDPQARCAGLALCRGCVKYGTAARGLKRLFFLIIPACVALAAMPLCADWDLPAYNTYVLGAAYTFSDPFVHQLFEYVYCPAAAMLPGTASFLVFSVSSVPPRCIFPVPAHGSQNATLA